MNSKYFAQTWSVFILLLLSAVFTCANAATLQATVNKRELVTNEVFQLRIVADERASADDLDLSILENDFFMGRPNFGTSVNIINSQRTSRSEWNVSLAPQRIGRVTIPAFELNGAKSEPIQIVVTKDEQEPEASDFVEISNQLEKDILYPQESTQLLSRVIIKTDPRRLQNPEISQPKLQGMTIAAIGDAKQYQSVLDGVEVTVVEQRYKITADSAGEFSLFGAGFDGTVIYGDSLRGSTRLIATQVEPEQLKITVKEPPADYQGTWLPTQSLHIEQKFFNENGDEVIEQNPIQLNVGQSLTRQITLDIHGIEPERFPRLSLDVPSGVRTYDEKPVFQPLSNGITRMIIKQVLIAQAEGEITIELPSINWWDSLNNISEKTATINTALNIKQGDRTLYSFSTNLIEHGTANGQINGVSVYWKYATLLLTAILIVSFMIIYRLYNKDHSSRTINLTDQSSNHDQTIIDIIKAGDISLINYHVNKWLDDNATLSKSYRASIVDELSLMNTNQCSHNGSTWDNTKLIKLIMSIKHENLDKNSNNNLPIL
ncbi:BatD family protein [Vibrio astriarenae]|uniref:BatD family protein n=1 Tax=Vibrio astriarenae TaxID=1481923 RepID=UPI003736F9CE